MGICGEYKIRTYTPYSDYCLFSKQVPYQLGLILQIAEVVGFEPTHHILYDYSQFSGLLPCTIRLILPFSTSYKTRTYILTLEVFNSFP